MKCVLLAAGYATRLYPLTENRPKSLLPVGDGTILDFIVGKVEAVGRITEILIVSNHRFFSQFAEWRDGYSGRLRITLLDDGTTTNENRLGAIADLRFAVAAGELDEDLLVLAGDNLFDFSLVDFVDFFDQAGTDCISVHALADEAALRRTGVVELDGNGRVTGFEEKPACPKSQWAAPPFYLFRRESLPLFAQYLAGGNNPDAPGHFIPWLIRQRTVYAWCFAGRRYDIGSLASYEEALRLFPPSATLSALCK